MPATGREPSLTERGEDCALDKEKGFFKAKVEKVHLAREKNLTFPLIFLG